MFLVIGCLVIALTSILAPLFVKSIPRKFQPAGPLLAAGTYLIVQGGGLSSIGSVLVGIGTVIAIKSWKAWREQVVIERGEAAVARMSKTSQASRD